MSYETVGDIAELLLQGEVDHYSRNQTNCGDHASGDAGKRGEVERTELRVRDIQPSAIGANFGDQENP